MFVKLLLSLLVLSLPAVRSKYVQSYHDLPNLRIVGGHSANPQQIPYQVSVEYYNRHDCGGTIISEYYVLTAAHCTEDKPSYMFKVRAGSVTKQEGGQLIRVKDVYPHPLYNSETYDYDVSLLELQIPLTFDSFVSAATLPEENEPLTALTGIASGWGQLGSQEWVLPKTLQFVELPIWKKEDCEKSDPDITDRMICTGFLKGGKDTCSGDSGGPFTSGGKLIAVISWGYTCADPKTPGVLIKVASVRKWIKDTCGV